MSNIKCLLMRCNTPLYLAEMQNFLAIQYSNIRIPNDEQINYIKKIRCLI